jgi:hypothetical protein
MRSAIVAVGLLLAGQASATELPDLVWMAGTWRLEKDGVVTRETWLSPLGGTMAGVTQTNRPGRPAHVEFATISAEPSGVTFTARPKGQAPTAFVLKPSDDGQVVFENPKHDFPQRVIYRRCGADLCARIEGTVRGESWTKDWRYRRELSRNYLSGLPGG